MSNLDFMNIPANILRQVFDNATELGISIRNYVGQSQFNYVAVCKDNYKKPFFTWDNGDYIIYKSMFDIPFDEENEDNNNYDIIRESEFLALFGIYE